MKGRKTAFHERQKGRKTAQLIKKGKKICQQERQKNIKSGRIVKFLMQEDRKKGLDISIYENVWGRYRINITDKYKGGANYI